MICLTKSTGVEAVLKCDAHPSREGNVIENPKRHLRRAVTQKQRGVDKETW